MPTPSPYPWRELSPEIVAVIQAGIPQVSEEIVEAIREAVPAYRRPLEGAFGRGLRRGVEQGIGGFIGLVESRSDAVPGVEIAARLGAGEAREGRPLDALLSAYRVGARVAWRRAAAAAAEHAGTETLSLLAEAIFGYIDELSAASADGFSAELAATRRRGRPAPPRAAAAAAAPARGRPRGDRGGGTGGGLAAPVDRRGAGVARAGRPPAAAAARDARRAARRGLVRDRPRPARAGPAGRAARGGPRPPGRARPERAGGRRGDERRAGVRGAGPRRPRRGRGRRARAVRRPSRDAGAAPRRRPARRPRRPHARPARRPARAGARAPRRHAPRLARRAGRRPRRSGAPARPPADRPLPDAPPARAVRSSSSTSRTGGSRCWWRCEGGGEPRRRGVILAFTAKGSEPADCKRAVDPFPLPAAVPSTPSPHRGRTLAERPAPAAAARPSDRRCRCPAPRRPGGSPRPRGASAPPRRPGRSSSASRCAVRVRTYSMACSAAIRRRRGGGRRPRGAPGCR